MATIQKPSLVALFVVWVTYQVQKYCHKGSVIAKKKNTPEKVLSCSWIRMYCAKMLFGIMFLGLPLRMLF